MYSITLVSLSGEVAILRLIIKPQTISGMRKSKRSMKCNGISIEIIFCFMLRFLAPYLRSVHMDDLLLRTFDGVTNCGM